MRFALVGAAVLFAGCATQPEVSLETKIATASNAQLCEAVFYAPPDVAQPADYEARRRGVNCQDYMQAISMQRAQQEANRAAAAQVFIQRALQPAPLPAPPRETICTSRVIGGMVRTQCHD